MTYDIAAAEAAMCSPLGFHACNVALDFSAGRMHQIELAFVFLLLVKMFVCRLFFLLKTEGIKRRVVKFQFALFFIYF